jgi:lipopolysaccharide biosynthesis regulator YciM
VATKKVKHKKSARQLRELVETTEDKATMLSCDLCGFKTRDPGLWNAHIWACG